MRPLEEVLADLQDGLDTPVKDLLIEMRLSDMRWREIAKALDCGYWEILSVARHFDLSCALSKPQVDELAAQTGLHPGSIRQRYCRTRKRHYTPYTPRMLVRRPWKTLLGMPLVRYLALDGQNVDTSTVMDRLKDGWCLEEALHTPKTAPGARPEKVWRPLPGAVNGDSSNVVTGHERTHDPFRSAQARRATKVDRTDSRRSRPFQATVDAKAKSESHAT